ncbi:MAG: hypothetical protein U1E83_04125 [Methylotetracoccus sp.]
MIRVTRSQVAVALAAAGFAGQAAAHIFTNFPTYDRGGLYEKSRDAEWPYYQDGAFGPIRFNAQHACDPNPYDPYEPNVVTNQVVVVYPTGKNTQIIDTTVPKPWNFPPMDPGYKELGPASPDANGFDWAVQFVKPMPHAAYPTAYTFLTDANNGDKIPQAVAWVGKQHMYDDTDLTTTIYFADIPKKSCVTEVQYYFATAQFCSGIKPGNAMPVTGWLLGPTENWPKERLGETTVQWAPIAVVERDLKKKPLPQSCGGKGQTISVYPSKADIDKYLRPVEVDDNDIAKQRTVQWWINKQK